MATLPQSLLKQVWLSPATRKPIFEIMIVNGIERSIHDDIESVMKTKLWEAFASDETDQTWPEDVEDAEYCAMMALDMKSCNYTRQIGIACLNKAFPWLNPE